MKSSAGTDALLALENAAPSVLFAKVPGTDFQLWPLLRWPVAKSMAQVELKAHAVARKVTKAQTAERALRRVMPNPFGPRRIRSQADFLFVVTGNTVSRQPDGVKNWLVDDHASAVAPRAIVLQDRALDGSTPKNLRPTFPRTYSFEDSNVRAEAAAKFMAPKKADIDFARSTAREIYDRLDFEVDATRMREAERQLIVRVSRARHTARLFERLLDRVRPEMVLMHTASYGDRSHLISLLKDRGIVVAEHQHGWIGPSHGAYNFGEAMWSDALRRCLPDVLLTFGDFWSSQVRTPSSLVPVGKPHLEAMAAGAIPFSQRPKEVVVVSSMYEPEETAAFTLAVRDSLPAGWTVLFRPHPTERPSAASRFPTLVDASRISFDNAPDVFETLKRVRGVIGLASTVLYEALAVGCQVYVKDSPLADLYIADEVFGERITDRESLERAMAQLVAAQGSESAVDPCVLQSIWQPDSVAAFSRFVAEFDAR